MTKYSFNNDSSPAERRRVLRETGASYHDVALSEVGTVQGRYGELEKSSSVTGGLAHRYPPLPETSPWASDPVGQEPPIGVDINAVEAVGTHAEIEQSLREASGDVGQLLPDVEHASPSGELQRSDAGHHSDVVETGSPLPKRKSRKKG